VNKFAGQGSNTNLKYYGMIVDGGMLTNYPIDAFNNVTTSNQPYRNGPSNLLVKPTGDQGEFKQHTVGFRLQSNIDNGGLQIDMEEKTFLPYQTLESIKNILGTEPSAITIGKYLEELYETTSYPAESGQIRSKEQKENTIVVNAGKISIFDFAPEKLDKIRGFSDRAKEKSEQKKAAKTNVLSQFQIKK
jgi:hypothetical protein